MFTLKQLITLALAGTAMAAPFARRGDGDYDGPRGRWRGNQGYVTEIVEDASTPTDSSDNAVVTVYAVPNKFNSFHSGDDSGSDDAPAPAAAPTSTPQSGSDATPSASSGSDSGYMAIVNKYRAAGGLPALQQSSKLEGNALKTCQDGHGQMKHELNPGSMGQVLAPGSMSKFESIYVGGWLCEMPSLKGLNGICSSMTSGWDHSSGDVGHAKILTDTSYKAIGCAEAGGIVGCDLGSS